MWCLPCVGARPCLCDTGFTWRRAACRAAAAVCAFAGFSAGFYDRVLRPSSGPVQAWHGFGPCVLVFSGPYVMCAPLRVFVTASLSPSVVSERGVGGVSSASVRDSVFSFPVLPCLPSVFSAWGEGLFPRVCGGQPLPLRASPSVCLRTLCMTLRRVLYARRM